MQKRICLATTGVLVLVAGYQALSAASEPPAGDPGHVYYLRLAAPELDRFTNAPNAAMQQWFRTHFFRMGVFTPYFDAKTSWYPDGLVYENLYGVDPSDALVHDHPDWILHDGAGRSLYIPFACKDGTCPHLAGDIANPKFRSWWIGKIGSVLSRHKYRGLWIDDVNMEFRVSDGYSREIPPIDSTTGRTMTWEAWRNYVATDVEEIRRAFPQAEILHNSIWFGGPQPARDADPAIRRQIRAADNINVERGIASDQGLTGGTGPFSLNALFAYIDRVHAAGPGVTLEEYSPDLRGKQYSLAGYFLISTGRDRIGDDANPETWWKGYEVELGPPLGPRTSKNGIYSRVFTRGLVFLGEPGVQTQTVPLPGTFTTLDGSSVSSISLSARQGAVLLRSQKK